MDIKVYLQEKKLLVEKALMASLPSKNTYPSEIHQAMHYSVSAGGKRLRPILSLAAAETVGAKQIEPLLPLLCSLEYIHTYTLIHDDLPAMDDDDYRRGKPACHKIYGEGVAILAGDALLTYAFELLTKLAIPEGMFPQKLVIEIIAEISKAIGSQGLIGGQTVDLQSEALPVTKEILEFIHKHKTGTLFKAAVVTGAKLGGADDPQLKRLEQYANSLGLAFQITDDILDVVGDPQLLGKPTGSDVEKKKATYPGLMGIKKARQLVEECVQNALVALEEFGELAKPLRELVIYVGKRTI